MTGSVQRMALAGTFLSIAMGGCKIPPWPDPTEGALSARRQLEAPIPWGKTCAIDVQARAGLDDGLRKGLRRAHEKEVELLREALARELAMVGVFRETIEKGDSDYRLSVEVLEAEKKRMLVSVVLRASQDDQPVAAFDVEGFASGPNRFISADESTANVTAFLITLGIDYRRKKP